MRRALIAGPAVVVLGALLMNCYGAWYIARRTDDRGGVDAARVRRERAALAGLQPRSVVIGEGRLRGWYAPGAADHPGWVLVHGAGGNRDTHLPLAQALNARGFPVLTLELSYASGRLFGGGQREAREIDEALRWMDARDGPQSPLLYGCSVGAFNAVVAVAKGARPAALVADSGPVSFPRTSADYSGLPEIVFTPLNWVYPVFAKGSHLIDVRRTVPDDGLDVPTLIIHGTGDEDIDPHHGRTMAEVTGGELWAPSGVGHCDAFFANPAEFVRRLERLGAADAPGARRT